MMKQDRILWINVALSVAILVLLITQTWFVPRREMFANLTVLYNAQGSLTPTPKYPVVLYTNSNYTGEAFAIPVGTFAAGQIFPANVPRLPANRWIKSAKMLPGASVKVTNVIGGASSTVYTTSQPSINYRLDGTGTTGDNVTVTYTRPPTPPPETRALATPVKPVDMNTVQIVGGQTCPAGQRLVTVQEAQSYADSLCPRLDEWAIARLGNNGSMNGSGYGCQINPTDNGSLGNAICVNQ